MAEFLLVQLASPVHDFRVNKSSASVKCLTCYICIRGQSIAISTAWKKNSKLLRQQTIQRLQELESRLPTSSSIRLLREIIRLRAILKSIDIGRVEKALQRLRQLYYDKGNKALTLLARKLRENTHTSTPQAILDPTGTLQSHPDLIAQLLKYFYSDLYNNPSIPHLPIQDTFKDRVQSYLATSGVSTLPVEALHSLNSPITDEEISDTLKHLPNNKAPGPDGLPYDYYKSFLPTLLPHMVSLFNRFMGKEEIPRDMQTSHLTLIPKPDKDHTLCGNYRPIALLNSDLKFFTKILSL